MWKNYRLQNGNCKCVTHFPYQYTIAHRWLRNKTNQIWSSFRSSAWMPRKPSLTVHTFRIFLTFLLNKWKQITKPTWAKVLQHTMVNQSSFFFQTQTSSLGKTQYSTTHSDRAITPQLAHGTILLDIDSSPVLLLSLWLQRPSTQHPPNHKHSLIPHSFLFSLHNSDKNLQSKYYSLFFIFDYSFDKCISLDQVFSTRGNTRHHE